ncbi:MAG: FecR domain-containing protein [Candidatus Omnitrophota bacterium]|jgi:hypothetical protein
MKNKTLSLLFFVGLIGMTAWGETAFGVYAKASQAGVAAAVKGDVKAAAPTDKTPHMLKSGDIVFLGDRIETGVDGQLQVLLLDQTVFTLGPLSAVTVDKFVYNPADDDGKVTASVVKGIFRIVSGKVAHKKPENMQVNLPTGSIGFRGTIVAGRSEGLRSLVVFLGPAGGEGIASGHIFVGNIVNGKLVGVDIDQKGYGTVIEGPNVAPVPAFKISEGELSSIIDALNGHAAGGSGVSGQTGVASSEGFDPQAGAQTLSAMSKIDEYTQKVAQGGMLTPPQPVIPTMRGGGRGEDDGDNKQR